MELFYKYQTFIAGILGFAGVILTIMFNAKQSRKLHDLKIESERNAIRIAIIEELKIISTGYEGNVKDLNIPGKEGELMFFPTLTHTVAYSQMISHFGLLSPIEIKKTMIAYQLVLELPRRLKLIESKDITTHREGFVTIEIEQRKGASGVYANFLVSIHEAILTLSENVKAP